MPEDTLKKVYEVQVLEVLSGDDLILMADLGVDGLYKKVRARLNKVDTPDAFKAPTDSPAGKVREEVRRLVYGKQCSVELHSQRKSGWIVTLFVQGKGEGGSTLCLNDYLINQGHIYKTRSPRDE